MLPVSHRLGDPGHDPVLSDVSSLAWTRGVRVSPVLIAGDARPVIAAVAQEFAADLLIIGGERRPLTLAAPTRRWLVAHARCPVLAVSTEGAPTPRPTLGPILAT
jgi:nucleotide-binding universal stress UspA family protein